MINPQGAFNQAWRAAGQPTLTAIGPISAWTLPPGYAYDVNYDRIVDGSGNVQDVQSSWYSGASDALNFAPTRNSSEIQALVMAGILSDGSIEIYIDADDAATMRQAWAVDIGSDRFRVAGVTDSPIGNGQVARVRLDRR